MLKEIFRLIAIASVCFAGLSALPTSAFADGPHDCEVTEVVEKSDLIHVKCANAWSGSITFFAIAKTEPDTREDHLISMATAALLSGRIFYIYVESDSGLNPSGCGTSNCRRINYFGLR
jgi:hypothetical protein